MERRNFVGGAVRTTLSNNISNTDTVIGVVDGSTFPSTSFTIVIGRGTVSEEKVFINSNTGANLLAEQRGYDDTTAISHSAGETVDHVLDALFLQHINDEVNAIIDSGASKVDSAESIIAIRLFS